MSLSCKEDASADGLEVEKSYRARLRYYCTRRRLRDRCYRCAGRDRETTASGRKYAA